VAEYDGNKASTTRFVSVRIERANSSKDYYIGYNRKVGINAGTLENGDQLTILEKEGGPTVYGQSWKLASIHPGQHYILSNFDGTGLDVKIKFVRLSPDKKDATVEVGVVVSFSLLVRVGQDSVAKID
jgi:hypothetical protein